MQGAKTVGALLLLLVCTTAVAVATAQTGERGAPVQQPGAV
jgi:hypothetical protein